MASCPAAALPISSAGHLPQGGFRSLACFHAQQAAAKAVKAFLYAQGAEDVRGHSVANLLQDAATYHGDLDRAYGIGASLNKLYIPTRYPNGLPGGLPMDAYLEEETLQALCHAEQVLGVIRRLLGGAPAESQAEPGGPPPAPLA